VNFEDAAMKAMEELSKKNPDYAIAFFALMVRILQLKEASALVKVTFPESAIPKTADDYR